MGDDHFIVELCGATVKHFRNGYLDLCCSLIFDFASVRFSAKEIFLFHPFTTSTNTTTSPHHQSIRLNVSQPWTESSD